MRHPALLGIALACLVLGPVEVGAEDARTTWQNLKLRLSEFQKLFRDQSRELGDLREQGIDPAAFTRIDLELLLDGGPPKDGIPSIDRPRFDSAGTTPFDTDERVIGLEIDGDARAYPYGILNWHEVVNDTVGGVPVTVSYCPLCDTFLVHERGGSTFGVTGKLFQSCLVMYDRADETLYAQPWALGIVGPAVNRELPRRPAVKTTLGRWLEAHPDSRVLSAETGHPRNYFDYPYGSYDRDGSLVFPVRNRDLVRGHPKRAVSYAWEPSDGRHPRNAFAGPSAAVAHERVREHGPLELPFGDGTAVAHWDDALETVVFRRPDGGRLVSSTAFAFVYPAFFGEPVSDPPAGSGS